MPNRFFDSKNNEDSARNKSISVANTIGRFEEGDKLGEKLYQGLNLSIAKSSENPIQILLLDRNYGKFHDNIFYDRRTEKPKLHHLSSQIPNPNVSSVSKISQDTFEIQLPTCPKINNINCENLTMMSDIESTKDEWNAMPSSLPIKKQELKFNHSSNSPKFHSKSNKSLPHSVELSNTRINPLSISIDTTGMKEQQQQKLDFITTTTTNNNDNNNITYHDNNNNNNTQYSNILEPPVNIHTASSSIELDIPFHRDVNPHLMRGSKLSHSYTSIPTEFRTAAHISIDDPKYLLPSTSVGRPELSSIGDSTKASIDAMLHNVKYDLIAERELEKQNEIFPIDSLAHNNHQIHSRMLGWQLTSSGRRRKILRALGDGVNGQEDPETLMKMLTFSHNSSLLGCSVHAIDNEESNRVLRRQAVAMEKDYTRKVNFIKSKNFPHFISSSSDLKKSNNSKQNVNLADPLATDNIISTAIQNVQKVDMKHLISPNRQEILQNANLYKKQTLDASTRRSEIFVQQVTLARHLNEDKEEKYDYETSMKERQEKMAILLGHVALSNSNNTNTSNSSNANKEGKSAFEKFKNHSSAKMESSLRSYQSKGIFKNNIE